MAGHCRNIAGSLQRAWHSAAQADQNATPTHPSTPTLPPFIFPPPSPRMPPPRPPAPMHQHALARSRVQGFTLPYPDHIFGAEFTYLFLWLVAEPSRCFLCSKGNLTETLAPLVWSLGLGLPIALLYMYFLTYQTYVLRIDLFLNGVAAGFCVLQILLTLFMGMTLLQQRRS